MGKRGFSATTAVLVAILIGALYMVGKTVTPPPPGPPEPPPVAKTVADPVVPAKGGQGASAAKRAEMMKKMEQEEYKRHGMKTPPGKKAGPVKKKFDPNSIDIAPAWNKAGDREMGHTGVEKLTVEVQQAKKEMAAQHRNATPPQPGAVPQQSGAQPMPTK